MILQITGKNLDVGQALRAYVKERLGITLDKYVRRSLAGHIRIKKERGNFRTDCSLQLTSGLHLQSRGESHDAYASADAAIERLEKRLRRYKRRLKKHHVNASPAEKETLARDYVISPHEEIGEQDNSDNPVIIAEVQKAVRELPVSEAVIQMDLSGTSVFIFRNAGHGGLNVVYRRDDGNIGWIDPGTENRAHRDPENG